MNFDLTEEEFNLLDGKCRPETQKKIDAYKAMRGLSNNLLPVQRAILNSDVNGTITLSKQHIVGCLVCGRMDEYYMIQNKRKIKKHQGYGLVSLYKKKNTYSFCNMCNEKYNIIEGLKQYIEDHNLNIKIIVHAGREWKNTRSDT